MIQKVRMTTRLKNLFERPELFVIPGGVDAMGAKMAQLLGFEAFYMSGGNTAAFLLGKSESGTSMRDMVDNARRIVMAVDIPVFGDMDTGYGDAESVYTTVKEFIRAGVAGAHLEDQTYPPTMAQSRLCISTEEMVDKLKAGIEAKMELDPDFVIVARCDYGWVPGATFEEVMERCMAYKLDAKADVICPYLKSWDEHVEAVRRIPGPVLPLFTLSKADMRATAPGSQIHPTLEDLQEIGAAAAWYPPLTTMVGLQATWDFLNDFKERGTRAIDDFVESAARGKWGTVSTARIVGAPRVA